MGQQVNSSYDGSMRHVHFLFVCLLPNEGDSREQENSTMVCMKQQEEGSIHAKLGEIRVKRRPNRSND